MGVGHRAKWAELAQHTGGPRTLLALYKPGMVTMLAPQHAGCVWVKENHDFKVLIIYCWGIAELQGTLENNN